MGLEKKLTRRKFLELSSLAAVGAMINPSEVAAAMGKEPDYDDAVVRARKVNRIERGTNNKKVEVKIGHTVPSGGIGKDEVLISPSNFDEFLEKVGADGFNTVYMGPGNTVGDITSYENGSFNPSIVPTEIHFGKKEAGDYKQIELDKKSTSLGVACYTDKPLGGKWLLPTYADGSRFSGAVPSGAVMATGIDGKVKYYLFDEAGKLLQIDTVTRTPIFVPDGLETNLSFEDRGLTRIDFPKPEGATIGYTYSPDEGWVAKIKYTKVSEYGVTSAEQEKMSLSDLKKRVKEKRPLRQSELAFLKDPSRFAVLRTNEHRYIGINRTFGVSIDATNVASIGRDEDRLIPGTELYNTQVLSVQWEQWNKINLGHPGVVVSPGATFGTASMEDRHISLGVGRIVAVLDPENRATSLADIVIAVTGDIFDPAGWISAPVVGDLTGGMLPKSATERSIEIYGLYNNQCIEYLNSLLNRSVMATFNAPRYGWKLSRVYSPVRPVCFTSLCVPEKLIRNPI